MWASVTPFPQFYMVFALDVELLHRFNDMSKSAFFLARDACFSDLWAHSGP